MPVLVLPIADDLDELFEDSRLAAIAFGSELRRIMVMAIDLAVMLVVGVLRPKDGWAYAASEVFNVVFALQRCYIRATQCTPAGMAEQVESSKIVGLAQGILPLSVLVVYREELVGDNNSAVLLGLASAHATLGRKPYLASEAIQMECCSERSYELTRQRLCTLSTCPYRLSLTGRGGSV